MAVITISRQYGTGGIAIAQKISEKLGYSFMYIDELVAACRERGLFRPDAIETLLDGEQPFGRQLWGALCLELWHQQFLDGMSYSGMEPTQHTGPPPTLRLAS